MMNFKNEKSKKNLAFIVSFEILAIVAIVLYVIVNITQISSFLDAINRILSPIFVGLIIAYLCNPILNFFEYKVFRWKKNTKVKKHLCRGLSMLMTIISFFAIFAIIIMLIVPQLISSISHLIENYESYLKMAVNTINSIANSLIGKFSSGSGGEYTEYLKYDEIIAYINKLFGNTSVGSFTELMDKIQEWWANYSETAIQIGGNVIVGFVNVLKNSLLGIFIAFYLLASKELRSAQIKKFRKACLNEKQDNFITEVVQTANKSFGGFIRGKLIDSVIIGLLSYLVFEIFDICEYNMLIATFIGITNIIPVFGPIIGAIPSALIVLISNPHKLLIFLVLVVLIQQLDGNVIGPKILGNSTNVSSFTVIIAITIMGNIFGIFGMIIGVPVFATIIVLVKHRIERKLADKNEPVDTESYLANDSLLDADKVLHKEESTWIYKYEHSDKHAKRLKRRAKKGNASVEENENITESTKNAEDAKDTVEADDNVDSRDNINNVNSDKDNTESDNK